MTKLDGKTAFVTGSGRGIGQALALKLAAEGAAVVVNDIDAAPAEAVVAEITAAGGRALAVPGSVTEDGFAERFINAGIDAFGGVDIIVNNAGYTWDSFIGKMTDAQFDAMIDVHLKAPFRILRAASGFIRQAAVAEAAEGREVFRKVVNISSVAGIGGNAGQTNYSSAKAGIIGMTKTLSKRMGAHEGQRQLRGLRLYRDVPDRSHGREEANRRQRQCHPGGHPVENGQGHGDDDPARSSRHTRGGRQWRLSLLHSRKRLHLGANGDRGRWLDDLTRIRGNG
jgi:NAD(P)-dependent dehydrogenase (short-subunit alcohol dehydrogenase family)